MNDYTLSGLTAMLLVLAPVASAQLPLPGGTVPNAGVTSERAASVGMLPHQKQGIPLDDKERNPFAERVVVEKSVASVDANSEESRIRAVLGTMAIKGAIFDSGAITTAFLEGIPLRVGEEMPQLIEGQTDILKVTKVTDKEIEITWVDVEGTEKPRKLVKPMNLEPTIEIELPSGTGDGSGLLTRIDPRAEEKRAAKKEEAALSSRTEIPSTIDE